MLEKILQNGWGKAIVASHPSSQAIFASERLQEIVTTLYQYVAKRHQAATGKPRVAWGLGRLITGGLTYGTYLGLEAASRFSESIVRGIGKAGEALAGYAADFADWGMSKKPDWENGRRNLQNGRQMYRDGKKEVSAAIANNKTASGIKNALVVAASLYAASLGYGAIANRGIPQDVPGIYQQTEGAQAPLPLDPIQEFNDVDEVLIYCNTREQAADVPRSLPGVRRVTVKYEGQRIPDRNYDLINLRGHTGDMQRLYDRAIRLRDDHAIVLFGGCNSHNFIPERAASNIALIGGQEAQETAFNNYVLRRGVQVLRSAQSWEEFNAAMDQSSPRISAQYNMPGDERYMGTARSGLLASLF
jgi:hypothetical protein